MKKQFTSEETTVTSALIDFASPHWVSEFGMAADFFGEDTSITFKPIYEVEMMKGYHLKQSKKSSAP